MYEIVCLKNTVLVTERTVFVWELTFFWSIYIFFLSQTIGFWSASWKFLCENQDSFYIFSYCLNLGCITHICVILQYFSRTDFATFWFLSLFYNIRFWWCFWKKRCEKWYFSVIFRYFRLFYYHFYMIMCNEYFLKMWWISYDVVNHTNCKFVSYLQFQVIQYQYQFHWQKMKHLVRIYVDK